MDDLCKSIVESYIPDIIDGLVSNNLNPVEVCKLIGMCENGESTHLPDHTTTWWDGGNLHKIRLFDALMCNVYSPILFSFSACTGGDSCCDGQCGIGEGDCDSNSDCAGNLLCGSNNCIGLTFDGNDDCCYVSMRSFRRIYKELLEAQAS